MSTSRDVNGRIGPGVNDLRREFVIAFNDSRLRHPRVSDVDGFAPEMDPGERLKLTWQTLIARDSVTAAMCGVMNIKGPHLDNKEADVLMQSWKQDGYKP